MASAIVRYIVPSQYVYTHLYEAQKIAFAMASEHPFLALSSA